VGEANVVSLIKESNAVIGGEGSGGVIWPAVNPTRDSFVGIALILELLAKEGKTLSQIAAMIPRYELRKEKFGYAGDLRLFYTKLQAAFPDGVPNFLDGLRLDFPDRSWIHARPSNTEPIIRIFAEAQNSERADELILAAKKVLAA
jgi:phosphomannomutase